MKLKGVQQRNTLIDAYPFRVADGWPASDLLKRPQTTAAHIIAQHRGAMADAGRFGSDLGRKWRLCLHGARLYRPVSISYLRLKGYSAKVWSVG